MRFQDRQDAGRQLGEHLQMVWSGSLRSPLVLALPRGGVPVAAEVAAAVGGELDVLVVRKIGAPGHEELGIGAIAEGSDEVVMTGTASALGLDADDVADLAARQQTELDRRIERYRGAGARPPVAGRDVILVDDGLATGATAEAALRALRQEKPHRLILAVPVCAPETRQRLATVADHAVSLQEPPHFQAVGAWYDDFTQTTDEEVVRLLARGSRAA